MLLQRPKLNSYHRSRQFCIDLHYSYATHYHYLIIPAQYATKRIYALSRLPRRASD